MDLPRRPSPPPRSPGLDRAQGTFREALAALRNLSNLVRSRNVGPRAILDLVPDVQSACGPLSQAAADVFGAITAYLDPAPLGELESFLNQRVELLKNELDAAASGSMNARRRLHLEQALGELWRDLNGARSLLSMLESSVSEADLTTDLVELLLQTYSGPPSVGQVYALIPAYIHGDGTEVPIDQPRTLAALIGCATEIVSAREGGTTQISVASQGGAWTASLTMTPEPQGIPLTIWGYGTVPPALPCLQAAAQRIGLNTSWDPDSWALVLNGRS